ncbi:efflux transporter outer membrane subunit [Enterobacter sp. E105B]|uniref:efflux transporter outer membrane subunit n=1 Tax=Enterobacter sp. E105B TaxID=3047465 RepID=UPI0025A0B204|nr:efflux transporter outer membrane subunit [Enterobacter sp. E105B]
MYRLSIIFLSIVCAGCVSLLPDYHRPDAPVPKLLPAADNAGQATLHQWDKVFSDHRLREVIATALKSNRDLHKAIADIAAAKALYQETRASLLPGISATLDSARNRTSGEGISSSASGEGLMSAFELDLFGRNRSLSESSRESWLASVWTAQNTRLTLVKETSTAWIALATDLNLLSLARQTMQSAEESLRLIRRKEQNGLAAAEDISSAQAVYYQARASVSEYQTQVRQDRNALELLTGAPVPDRLLPDELHTLTENSIAIVPAGTSSSVLLRRPDIKEAEHNLIAANADIGAARANFFPSLSLTASAGVGSRSLSGLFSGGQKIWTFSPSLSLPLFTGGKNLAQLRYAEAQKKGYIATYEKTIQSAFKDVSDALARRQTLTEQLDAQRNYVAAEQKTLSVALRKYEAGTGEYLSVQTAYRALWAAEQQLITLQQTDMNNRIQLWQSLGGGFS